MNIYSFYYSLPYIFLFLLLLFLHFCEIRKINILTRKQSRILCFVILIYFFGFRGFLGTDFSNYYLAFKYIPKIYKLDFLSVFGFEPGFSIYMSLLKTIWNNYHFFIFVSSLIDLWVLFWFFKKYTFSIALAFIFFLVYRGLIMEYDLLRNMKALDLFLISIPYIFKRKFIWFALLNILGITFHTSAILFFICYFITFRLSFKIVLTLIILCNILFILGLFSIIGKIFDILYYFNIDQRIILKIGGYIVNGEKWTFNMLHIANTINVIIILFKYKDFINKNIQSIFFINGFILYYLSTMIFSEVVVLTQRITLIFIMGEWVTFCNFFSFKFRKNKLLCPSLLILAFILFTKESCSVIRKYDNVFFGIENFNDRVQSMKKFQLDHQ